MSSLTKNANEMSVTSIGVKHIDSLEASLRQIDFRHFIADDLKLAHFVGPSESLLISRQHLFDGADNVAQSHECSELGRDFCLINAFDVGGE